MVKLTDTAQKVLEERYYIDGESKWEHLVHRVCTCFTDNEDEYPLFYHDIHDMNWLPNSPVLMNAGTNIKAYSACYVLPVEDNIESIYKFYSDAALISKSGGGVGANYSAIRSKDSVVASTGGVASGPLSFIKVQDVSTEIIKQGGRRRGANMGILNCDHPDIWDFISAKDTAGEYENFNFSVGITDEFMDSVTDPHMITVNGEYEVDEDDRANIALWDEIIRRAHSSAEPGVLFMDTIEKGNTVPHLGKLEATNPCGEQPLLPYESCSLASINLSNHVCEIVEGINGHHDYHKSIEVDWDKLKESIHNIVLFMNRVLDKSEMPIPEAQAAMEATKKIGIGIMGLHDMLIQLGLAYDSEEGRELASSVMEFIADECHNKSMDLGMNEGYFKGDSEGLDRRNANLTTIAPTGTLSMIADCSSGCEPYYAPGITYKTVLDDTTFAMCNRQVLEMARELQVKEEGIEWVS